MPTGNRSIRNVIFSFAILFSTSAFSVVTEYTLPDAHTVPTATFITGSTGHIRVPVSVLSDAKVASADGLVFRFADGSNFSVQTLTDRSTGHAGVNMHTWPEYLLGLKTKGPEPESYVKDLKLSGEHIIKDSIAPTEIRRFSTKNGTGYWAVGKEKSAIVLTNTDITDQITVIYTKDMSESKILNTILNGVSL
ncbi:hypothetical protein FT643_18460 [Ketobacter sp. MCCC 1A13808]|mgnify:CR=1 FL=1|uniref:hypothetical protein n=1 Tax=Ketobacter sp. MCCC 1A13808 TaxID=2602738 RepID=UPI000F27E719|nr:hypothetical protein [Ketobacter sp. MCCC 1A13808]MVF14124.1 hypothetical protein [Ketobacter sp. MCCC 1A13808]RLP55149.1 MAG: hypothetical protein D6160_07925 [Ketobacter sp.]